MDNRRHTEMKIMKTRTKIQKKKKRKKKQNRRRTQSQRPGTHLCTERLDLDQVGPGIPACEEEPQGQPMDGVAVRGDTSSLARVTVTLKGSPDKSGGWVSCRKACAGLCGS